MARTRHLLVLGLLVAVCALVCAMFAMRYSARSDPPNLLALLLVVVASVATVGLAVATSWTLEALRPAEAMLLAVQVGGLFLIIGAVRALVAGDEGHSWALILAGLVLAVVTAFVVRLLLRRMTLRLHGVRSGEVAGHSLERDRQADELAARYGFGPWIDVYVRPPFPAATFRGCLSGTVLAGVLTLVILDGIFLGLLVLIPSALLLTLTLVLRHGGPPVGALYLYAQGLVWEQDGLHAIPQQQVVTVDEQAIAKPNGGADRIVRIGLANGAVLVLDGSFPRRGKALAALRAHWRPDSAPQV
ncbi:hypothetical protein E1200_15070 [Actinomadura sp. GC306]|uniref:hypothetical protein n=1 Tax=Actinomadura sp. GC306 TaxID=2530367 RepID=UPI001045A52A|nr:hypothetical protein [Actinomadura sp. GC306]TDC67409.1 hypothetical protein E1200_15070 [Actinomadura sp. GC306]